MILLFKKGRELGTFYYTRIFMWFTISVQKVCVRDISLWARLEMVIITQMWNLLGHSPSNRYLSMGLLGLWPNKRPCPELPINWQFCKLALPVVLRWVLVRHYPIYNYNHETLHSTLHHVSHCLYLLPVLYFHLQPSSSSPSGRRTTSSSTTTASATVRGGEWVMHA